MDISVDTGRVMAMSENNFFLIKLSHTYWREFKLQPASKFRAVNSRSETQMTVPVVAAF